MWDSITIESMFDGRSHHGSFRQHLWYRWKGLLVLRALLSVAMIGIGAFFMIAYNDIGKAQLIGSALVVMGSFALVRPMVWQMWSERKLRKHPAYGSKIMYKFSKEGIMMDGKSGKVEVPWVVFKEVVALPKGMILYQNKKDYMWIPAYDFKGDEMEQICEWFVNQGELKRSS